MDALGAAIILRENRGPDSYYRGLTSLVNPISDPAVLLHFEIKRNSEPTSPEIEQSASSSPDVELDHTELMKRLRKLIADNSLPGDEWEEITRAVEEGENAWQAVPKEAPLEQGFNGFQRLNQSSDQLRKDNIYQNNSNFAERAQRAKAVANQVDNDIQMYSQSQAAAPTKSPSPELAGVRSEESSNQVKQDASIVAAPETTDIGPMRGIWLGGELFLLRKVTRKIPDALGKVQVTSAVVQGVWLDSKVLRDRLLKEVEDLLPHSRLEIAEVERAAVDPLAMVSFPFRLERNESVTNPGISIKTPFGAALWVAWGAVALAVITSSLLVRGVMRLSERRASFVSAVTHELRTPLTTFRLYSDMMESGAVKEEKRGTYLRVLSREADRLSHLVENVLAFSRIERGNARSNIRSEKITEMLESMRERFEARLATAGMTLELQNTCDRSIRVDTAAVEHILFNLIDNAAKYAAGGDPPVVKITTRETGHCVEITVSDHGPGISVSEHKRIFRAFHKSAREAAESQPGVGLGLALSRRLAKAQGGDLECEDSLTGACFVLRLPPK